jgi:hypothetical protein
MHEVPCRERPLLALDEQETFTGQDEEILLCRFGVVQPFPSGLENARLMQRSANGALSPSKAHIAPRWSFVPTPHPER